MPCARGMKVRGEDLPGCKASCLHRLLVEEHRLARAAWELLREEAANGHDTESAEFEAANPGPLFKDRLIANKRSEPAPVERIDHQQSEVAA